MKDLMLMLAMVMCLAATEADGRETVESTYDSILTPQHHGDLQHLEAYLASKPKRKEDRSESRRVRRLREKYSR